MRDQRLMFDNIVVGAGSAGCAVAARLSEDPNRRVLLIEAGEATRSLLVSMPAANGYVFGNPRFDWMYRTCPQENLLGRSIYWPRGLGVGGTSLINGMVYIRGNRQDYDDWSESGAVGWSYDQVLPYFKKSEGSWRGDNTYHSSGGPLKTTPAGNFGVLDELFLEAARSTGHADNEDFNGSNQCGFGRFDVNVFRGRRMDSRIAFLRPAAARPNLCIWTNTRALRLCIEKGTARGIEITDARGSVGKVTAHEDIILSLGSISTPQLLMLSGIGEGDQLRRLGLDVHANLPGVGKGLQDHIQVPLQYHCRDPRLTFDRFQRPWNAIGAGMRYLLTSGGPGAAPYWSTGGFVAMDDDDHPHFQIFFTPMCVTEDPHTQEKKAFAGFQIDVSLMRPQSRGTVELVSSNPKDHPRIDPKYLSHESDRKNLIEGVRRVREIAMASVFNSVRGDEIGALPHHASDEAVMSVTRQNCISGYHPTGTCRMGSSSAPASVVDSKLRVLGIRNVRIADMSITPTIPAGNTHAPAVMIGEKAADLIQSERK